MKVDREYTINCIILKVFCSRGYKKKRLFFEDQALWISFYDILKSEKNLIHVV